MTDAPRVHWKGCADGARMACRDLGSGPVTLVVAHGWVAGSGIGFEDRGVRVLWRVTDERHVYRAAG